MKNARSTMKKMKMDKKLSFLSAQVPHLRHHKGVKHDEHIVVDITPWSVAKGAMVVLFTVMVFYFLYDISSILLLFFISFLFAAALDPLVDKMELKKVPRVLSMLGIYILAFLLLGFFFTKVGRLLVEQIVGITQSVGEFASNGGIARILEQIPYGDQFLPYFDQLSETVNVEAATSQLQGAFGIVSDQLVSLSVGLFNLLIVLVLTFFMVVEERSIDEFFHSLFPPQYSQYISTRMMAVRDQIGLWSRGQLMVSLIAGIMSYVGLVIMGVDYALTLSFIAGISMVIPVAGRFFAWIVTLPIVSNQSPTLAVWMSIYYLAIQQVENNFLVPYVMNKAVGLNPIVIIFALMVGGHYLGILGFVLAIPVATTFAIFFRDFTENSKKS